MNTRSHSTSEPPIEPLQNEQLAQSSRVPASPWVWVVPAAIALVAFALTFAQTKDYGLLGYDSYPIIITSRVQSPADFVGNFTERLMDGRYPGGFYRPLLNFSFALDYAIWQFEPIGYQLTNALLFGGCALALFVLMRRLARPGAFVAPLAAMLFLLLHPAHFEVVPVPPRRADLLCCLFLALSLTFQLSPKALAMRRPPILPAVFGLLAIASKETGLILPVLAYFTALLCSPRAGFARRALRALIVIVPQIAAAAIMVAARIAVIGSMGGHGTAGLGESLKRLPSATTEIVKLLICPQAVMQRSWLAPGLAGAVVVGVLITWALVSATTDARRTPMAAERKPGRAAVVGLLWLALTSATYALVDRIEPWYTFLPVAGLALLVAAAVATLTNALLRDGRPARFVAVATLLALLGLFAWQARYTPLFQRYDEYERATAAGDEFFQKLKTRIDAAAERTMVLGPALPRWVRPQTDAPTVCGAAILADYSVQAWAELSYPQRRIRIATGRPASIQLHESDEVVVALFRLLRGFEGPLPQTSAEHQPRPSPDLENP